MPYAGLYTCSIFTKRAALFLAVLFVTQKRFIALNGRFIRKIAGLHEIMQKMAIKRGALLYQIQTGH